MLIPTNVATTQNVERVVEVIVWTGEALPKYSEETTRLNDQKNKMQNAPKNNI